MSPGPEASSSIDDRVALMVAVVAAGGLLSPLAGLAGVALALALVLVARALVGPGSATRPPLGTRLIWAEPLGLALMLVVLIRALARTLIATPAMLVALPLVVVMVWSIPRIASSVARWLAAIGLAGLVVGAGLVGLMIERAGPTPRGMVHSGPLLGVHPRQAVAVTIDGFGPHDVIADDYIEPDGRQGRGPQSWAERLESELHAIAELHYSEGPARAREAFARAEVVVVDPALVPSEADLHDAVVGVEVRSGTTGEGSRVEFGCPGAVNDPRSDHAAAPSADCPRKYARDGSTGLGLSPRWAGYTEQRGRDRLRIVRLLGWPSGDAIADRRALAAELGLFTLMALIGILASARRVGLRSASEPAILGLLALFGVALIRPGPAIAPAELGMVLPLAAMLPIVGAAGAGSTARSPRPLTWSTWLTWLVMGVVITLGLSPLAGLLAPAGELAPTGAALREVLVIDAGASWGSASVIAASVAILAIVPGIVACARALIDERAPAPGQLPAPHGAAWRGLLTIVVALGLATRKLGGDPALLTCASAIILACWLPAGVPAWRRGAATLLLALGLGSLLFGPGPRDPVVMGVVVGATLLSLLVGSLPDRTRLEP